MKLFLIYLGVSGTLWFLYEVTGSKADLYMCDFIGSYLFGWMLGPCVLLKKFLDIPLRRVK